MRFKPAIGYYGRFIQAFSRLATPRIASTKKYARFRWMKDCQRSFNKLKEQLTAILLLTYPDLNKSMVLYTDASDQYIGACFTQPCPGRDGPVPGIPEEIPDIDDRTYQINVINSHRIRNPRYRKR